MQTGPLAAVLLGVMLAAAAGCGGGQRSPAVAGSAGAIVTDAHGRIVAAGRAQHFAVARFTANGRLDRSFGSGGIVVTSFAGHPAARTKAVAVQPDGMIVALGRAGGLVALARYLPDGRLDRTFGERGTTVDAMGDYGALAGALGPDGRIVVAGARSNESGFEILADTLELCRYTRDGRRDRCLATQPQAPRMAPTSAVAVRLDGKLVIVGSVLGDPMGVQERFAVARLLANGRFDPAFGSSGFAEDEGLDDMGGSATEFARDGTMVTAGSIGGQTALARLTPDGRADRHFGTDGKVVTEVGVHSFGAAVVTDPDGAIVVGGAREAATPGGPRWFFLLLRYTADGNQDGDFGTGGRVVNWRLGPVDAITVQEDGSIVASAEPSHVMNAQRTVDFVLTRYTADGELDPSFGSGGTVFVSAHR